MTWTLGYAVCMPIGNDAVPTNKRLGMSCSPCHFTSAVAVRLHNSSLACRAPTCTSSQNEKMRLEPLVALQHAALRSS